MTKETLRLISDIIIRFKQSAGNHICELSEEPILTELKEIAGFYS